MHPILAFTLLEFLIAVAIIAILIVLLGPTIIDAIKRAMSLGRGRNVVPVWQNPAATIPANTPSTFTILVQEQRLDSQGHVVSTLLMPQSTPALFDLIMIRGSGSIVSATVDGNALPQNKAATVGTSATNALGATDANGLISVVITLAADSQAQLVAHQSPDPAHPGWTVAPLTITTQ